jgi:Tol biopolymer transport system component
MAALAGAARWYVRPSCLPSIARFIIVPAAPLTTPSPYRDIDISPDGTHIVYNTGTNPPNADVWIRDIDQLEAIRLQGLDTPKSPFFSADNQWIGFFADVQADPSASGRELRRVSIRGGSPISIAPFKGVPQGATWNAGNTIVFATTDPSTGLLTVSADGGRPTVLTTVNPTDGEVDHVFPSFLPSGEAVLFTVTTKKGIDNAYVAVLDLNTGKRKALIRGASDARYVDTGHLVYVSAGALRVVRFDPIGLNVLSDPVTVVDHVLIKTTGAPDFSVSSHGRLVYVPSDVEPPRRSLVWVDRQGHEERVNAPPRAYVYPRVSPDGMRVALDIRDQDNDIWVWDLAHETLSRVTADPAADVAPVWTPDGQDIIFGSSRDGVQNLYRQPADGSRPAVRLAVSSDDQFPLSISPDGTQLVVRQNDPVFNFDLFLLHLNGPIASRDRAGQPLVARLMQTASPKDNGIISPDGRWIAFESYESAQYQIYVRPFPDVDRGRWQLSNAGGRAPLWAPNGRELFYMDSDGLLTRVPVEISGTFQHGKPERVLSTSYYRVNIRTYDVSRDGRKFLVIKNALDPQRLSTREIIVVDNWFEESNRRAPTR